MRSAKTFKRGGVEPREEKTATSRLPIKNAHIPAIAVLPLSQHAGVPAASLVSVGDEVKEGMMIARAGGFVSANIHSPVPGTVREIKEIVLPQGIRCRAVVIECAGEFDRSGKIIGKQSWENLDGRVLNGLIAEMGVVGLGGKAFPTHAKFALGEERLIKNLIVNGVECEPYITVDHRLMLEKPDEVLEGVRIAQKITGAEKVVIAIEETKTDAARVMGEKIREHDLPFSLALLKKKYPQGDEIMILKALLNQEVPSGGLPLDVGAVVSNVHTLFSVYEAVVWRKPLIERVITVSGSAVAQPANVKARIGTKIGELFEECGGFSEPPFKIILGGPMTGVATEDLNTPLTKDVSGLIALTRRESGVFDDHPCIRCGRCRRVCPRDLDPMILFKLLAYADYSKALDFRLLDCTVCGCCAFVCPARISLVQAFRTGKTRACSEKKG